MDFLLGEFVKEIRNIRFLYIEVGVGFKLGLIYYIVYNVM